MRTALLVLLVACGGDAADVHRHVDCIGYTSGGSAAALEYCEIPCEMAGSGGGFPEGDGSACTGTHQTPDPRFATAMCTASMDYMGSVGCCRAAPSSAGNTFVVLFYTCH